ncbi:hypothetical protein ElyMa_003411500, partial [Elysia marginata]
MKELKTENNILKEDKKEMLVKQQQLEEGQKHAMSCRCGFPKINRGIQVSDKMEQNFSKLQKEKKEDDKLISNLRDENEGLSARVDALKSEIESLKKQVKSEQTMKSGYKRKCAEMEMVADVILSSENDVPEKGKDEDDVVMKGATNNVYSDSVRLTFMALQGEANVAASNCSKVVNIVSKYLYKKEIPLDKLPCIQTILNMSAEGQYLSKHQTVEKILECPHFTLGSDATSREKKHYLEQHIVLSDGNVMSLGFSEIATDDAQTLLEKTLDLFNELCKIYCDDENVERDIVFKEIISKMKCLMSDRASVMKLFDKKMAELRNQILDGDVQTHFLFCNAHFLLGISGAVENSMRELEKIVTEDGEKLGRDDSGAYARFSNSAESSVSRLTRTAAEVMGPRGDDKSGCRSEWLEFLDGFQDVKSRFCSFRANRFNNVFENASAIVFHQHHIVSFLEDFVSHSNLKLKSVVMDLQDERIMDMMRAFSKFNFLVTSPYWKLMNSNVPYSQFHFYVKRLKTFLELSDPRAPAVFPEFSDPKFDLDFEMSDLFHQTFKQICSVSLEVLQRQLNDFYDDGIFAGDVPQDVLDVLKTCPLTNLIGERLFGDLDFDMSKRRRASLLLRTSLNMWKHNKT